MLRKLFVAVLVVAFAAVAVAQDSLAPAPPTFEIAPTEAPGAADAIAKGSDRASVTQEVRLILPQATALHLDASVITFDLTDMNGANNWIHRATTGDGSGLSNSCIYAEDKDLPSGGFWGQSGVMPGGTKYDPQEWPYITISGTQAVNYPPLLLQNGELVEGSKDYFVCYQSFILQLFSNFQFWDLSVARNDTDKTKSIEHLYVQGNTCADFGAGTGLYTLNDGETRRLIPPTINAGTTGRASLSSPNCRDNSSWMDVLGVLAVKVNSDSHGTSVANLRYTLVSADTQFGNTLP